MQHFQEISTTILFALFFFLLPTQVQLQNDNFIWPGGKKAALSLSFDDARLSNVDVGLPLFKEYDSQVTFYVNPEPMRLRMAGWKQAVEDGHEIGNHTDLHPCTGNFDWSRKKALEGYTLTSMRNELIHSNKEIEAMLGVLPQSFAYTCGNTFVGRGLETKSYVPLIAELFQSGRGWLNEAPNDPNFVDLAQVQGIEMDGKDFKADIEPILEKAKTMGSWVVLAGHEIGEPNLQTTETKMLRQLFSYLEASEDIWFTTVGEAARYIQQTRTNIYQSLANHLTFYSSYDAGIEADYAKGDPNLYSAPSQNESAQSTPGIGHSSVTLATTGGRYGGALQFHQKTKEVIYYRAAQNVSYHASEPHAGTISFWLSLDPEVDLEPGYCDPIQVTDAGYNDAAYWVDFSDKNPRLFRMGIFGDLDQWNPQNIGPDENPDFKNRLVVAKDRPFAHQVWTHIVITFSDINSKGGQGSLFVNGLPQGTTEIPESFTWDLERAKIFLGLNYIGFMDELALFDKALNANEVQLLYQLEGGVKSMRE